MEIKIDTLFFISKTAGRYNRRKQKEIHCFYSFDDKSRFHRIIRGIPGILEMIKEAEGDVAQGTQDILGGGAQSTSEGAGCLGVVGSMGNVGGMRSV